jgi:hypothetical protein
MHWNPVTNVVKTSDKKIENNWNFMTNLIEKCSS